MCEHRWTKDTDIWPIWNIEEHRFFECSNLFSPTYARTGPDLVNVLPRLKT